MAGSDLSRFVHDALRSGQSRAAIEAALVDAGWSREQVQDALGAYADVDFPVPVPHPRPQVSARDAFMYLVMFGMLYVSAYQLGTLLFQFINLGFPDPLDPGLDQRRFITGRIRSATASLMVTFPVFLYVASRMARRVASDPAQRMSAVRKWLTYVTLFIAACVIVGDLVALLNGGLSGDLTVRFVLKTLAVAAIAGSIFSYYLWSMRVDDQAIAR
jgi:hypothetical protein